MRRVLLWIGVVLCAAIPALAQGKRLWVLRANGEVVEYDLATFAAKGTVKAPAETGKSPQGLSVNHEGQMLFANDESLPLSESDVEDPHKVWFWNGATATTIDQGVSRTSTTQGSNQVIAESVPEPSLSTDGKHLFWFANDARRFQREDIDLSTATTWRTWQTDLGGAAREELASLELPDCRCKTGTCDESCAYGKVWVPEGGVDRLFLLAQVVGGATPPIYKDSSAYKADGGKWSASALAVPLRHVLDAASNGDVIVEAVPDTGCCGWTNQSNDQTLLRMQGKVVSVFDEQSTYRNPDYDVSFYTSNAKLSPENHLVAITITATSAPNQAIQLAQDGQSDPAESLRIRKALAELPAVEVKSVEDTPRRTAFVPHATLVGWISEKEILIVENHLLVGYNVATGARRTSSVRVEDAGRVFLR
jgi:hypothetical protein